MTREKLDTIVAQCYAIRANVGPDAWMDLSDFAFGGSYMQCSPDDRHEFRIGLRNADGRIEHVDTVSSAELYRRVLPRHHHFTPE